MRNKWYVLGGVAISLIMIFVDQTALPVALVEIQRDLSAERNLVQQVINLYLLFIAMFILLAGKLGDRKGHFKIFSIGLTVFFLSSFLAGIASNIQMLLSARCLQGMGAALMMPTGMVMLVESFTEEERGKAMGIYFISTTLFLVFGPLLGGCITQWAGWQGIFYLNLPLIVLSYFLIRKGGMENSLANSEEIDWLGFVASSGAIGLFVYFMIKVKNKSLFSLENLLPFFLWLGCILVWLRYSLPKPNAFVKASYFKNKIVRNGFIIISLMQIALVSTALWPLYLQDVLKLNPIQSSVWVLSGYLPILLSGPIAGKLYDLFGPRLPAVTGMILLSFGLLWIAVCSFLNFSYGLILGFFLAGFSFPFIISAVMISSVSYSAPNLKGAMSGLVNAGRQIGGAMGLAFVGAFSFDYLFISSFTLSMLLAAGLILIGLPFAFQLPARQIEKSLIAYSEN